MMIAGIHPRLLRSLTDISFSSSLEYVKGYNTMLYKGTAKIMSFELSDIKEEKE